MESTAPIKPTRRTGSPLVAALLILGIAVLAYQPVLDAGFIIDDPENLTTDPRMGSVAGLQSIWTDVGGPDYRHQYYPLTTTAFWVQHHYFGMNPVGYHAVNVLLHAINALLLWRLLRRLAVPGAWVAGVVFAIHPVHVETVAWVSELKNVLAAFFCLLAAWCFVKREPGSLRATTPAADSPAAPADREAGSPFLYLLSLIFFAAALLSKPAAAVLPAALLIMLWWKRALHGRALAALTPMILMAAASAALAVYLETTHAAPGDTAQLPWVERWMLAGRSLCFYAATLGWPVSLCFIYPGFELDAASLVDHAWSGGVVAGLLLLLLASRWIGRGPAAAAAIFVVALAPITFLDVSFTRFAPVADHWQYWSSMPLLALGAAVGTRLWWMGRNLHMRRTALLATLVYVAALGGITWQRALVFQSPRLLWSDTVARNPSAWVAHAGMGRMYAEAGDRALAIESYQRAVGLRPAEASLHTNLGHVLQGEKLHDMAESHYRIAIDLNPSLALPRANLGALLLSKRNVGDAIAELEKAVRLDPRLALAHGNLGSALVAEGRPEDAIAHFRQAVVLEPGSTQARQSLANTLVGVGRLDEALEQFDAALGLSEEDPALLNDYGAALLRAGRADAARVLLERSLALAPGNGLTLHNLGLAEKSLGRLDLSIAYEEQALQARPDDAAIHHALGRSYLRVGRDLDGIRHLRIATTLQPFLPAAHADLALALATHPGTTSEIAERAASHARRAAAQSGRQDASILRVLSLALAASGRFHESLLAALEAQAVEHAALAEVPEQ